MNSVGIILTGDVDREVLKTNFLNHVLGFVNKDELHVEGFYWDEESEPKEWDEDGGKSYWIVYHDSKKD